MDRMKLSWQGLFRKSTLAFLLLIQTFQLAQADEHNHKYKDGEEVVLWINNVGPKHNQQENYNYFSLPFCRGPKSTISHYHETISERMLGIQLEFSGLDIKFKENVDARPMCSVKLTKEDCEKFIFAVENEYLYEVFLDDLPWKVPVGIVEDNKPFIFQHKQITIAYNQNRIIELNVTALDKAPLEPSVELKFTYEVHWVPTQVSFADRFNRYKDVDFFQHRVHWFSIFNSFVMVLFTLGFVYLILARTLKKDIAAYNKDDDFVDLEKDMMDDYGWKQIHGDVFRNPAHPMLLASLVGSGCHIAVTSLFCIVFAIIGELYTERASLLSTCIFLYSTTCSINGFVGGSLFSQWKGHKWIRQMIFSTFLCPSLLFSVSMIVNFLAASYGAIMSISFGTAISILAILVFVMVPLNLVGTILGRALLGQANYPCRVNPIPRPIPEKQWYMEPWALALMGGLLPAGSVFIEVYFIFTSFWANRFYYVFDFMLLVFFMLIMVTVSVSIICTYFLLNTEDYRWKWTSFMSGASISVYMYIYSLYYFLFKTKMYGMFQTFFYFGYMGVFCSLLGIMCGTAAYLGSNVFVKKIYSTIKID